MPVVTEKLKKCNKCEQELTMDAFGKEKRSKDGRRSTCKECRSRLEKEYYEKNKDKHAARVKRYRDANRDEIRRKGREYYAENKDKFQEYNRSEKKKESNRRYRESQDKENVAEYQRQYQLRNRKRLNAYLVERRKNDDNLRVLNSLRPRMNKVLKGANKSASTVELIGCSVSDLMFYLESLFQEGMSWGNYGDWHIDHIIPCSVFDLTVPEEQRKCFHYSNLQPLWAEDNLRKGNRI